MADETPVTPDPETPEQEIPEAVCVSELKLHSSKVYTQKSVDILIQKVTDELHTQIASTKSELEQKIEEGDGGTGAGYKGVVEHESELATIASSGTVKHGDWYIARDTGKSFVWTVKDGTGSWVQMSSTVDNALVDRVTAAETKLNKITTALGDLLNVAVLDYETYNTDDLLNQVNILLRVLKAAVATEEPEPEPQP